MAGNLLRDEFARKRMELKVRLDVHDRGVLTGVALSLVPLFPVALIGLLIGLFHRRLHAAGKLSAFDYALARKGLVLAAINTVLSFAILAYVLYLLHSIDVVNALVGAWMQVRDALLSLLRLGRHVSSHGYSA